MDRPREVALKGSRKPSQSMATALGFDEAAQWIAAYIHFGEKDDPEATVLDVLQWLKPPMHGKAYDGMNHIGINRICMAVDDVDKMYKDLKAKGVKFLSPPQDIRINLPGAKPGRICVCKDPDGVFIEFSERE